MTQDGKNLFYEIKVVLLGERNMSNEQYCEMCKREVDYLTKHHLIPKCRHRNKKNKKNFSRQEVRERVLEICRPCHSNLHNSIDIKELEYDYNTLDKLLKHPEVLRFTRWIRKKPAGYYVKFR